MGISLNQFRAYGQQTTNIGNNLRVGHFGKLREVAVGERGRFGKVQEQTTPAQNEKVRTTLLKAMRNDLKSTFGGVFKSTGKNLNWVADKLLNKMENNTRIAGQGLTGKAVSQMLTKYDSYKTELKQALASAKQMFRGKELTGHYKELQQARPSEISTTLSRLGHVHAQNMVSELYPELTNNPHVSNWINALSDNGIQHLKDSLTDVGRANKHNKDESLALCKATVGKAITVLSGAYAEKGCSAEHVTDVIARIISNPGEAKFIGQDLDRGAINPFPRGHKEVRATYSEHFMNKIIEKFKSNFIKDGSNPVDEKTTNSKLRCIAVDVNRDYTLSVNGTSLNDSIEATLTEKDRESAFIENLRGMMEAAVEKNLPKNLPADKRELMKSHVMYAGLALANQQLEKDIMDAQFEISGLFGNPDHPVPFVFSDVGIGGSSVKSINLVGQGDGSWKMSLTSHKTSLNNVAYGVDAGNHTLQTHFDPKDSQNEISNTIDLTIRVSLTEDGNAETHVSFEQPPTVTARLNTLTPEEYNNL